MSSLGRPSFTIDLNTGTVSALEELSDRVQQVEDNVGEPSRDDILDSGGAVLQDGNNATGLNLKVETNQTDIQDLQDKVGADDTPHRYIPQITRYRSC